jgi:hypothetical protein|tara:strand:- start:7560 stop:7856 length:297 start_codon:yes stop_codon:yes gene_type:complete
MELFELTEENNNVIESKLVWARKGKSITKKYRCTFGKRKGRLVASPSQCSAPIDLKKRFVLKRTKAQKGARMARKARFTKKFNPASKAVARMNKAMRR